MPGIELCTFVPIHWSLEDLLRGGATALLLVAAAVLFFRSFRERYLLAWSLGWAAYLIYRVLGMTRGTGPLVTAVSQASFIVSTALFAISVLYYIGAGKRTLPITRMTLIGLSLAALQPVFWPTSRFVLILLHLSYLAVIAFAVTKLALYARGRRELGIWLMAPMLLFLRMDAPRSGQFTFFDVGGELLLGVSMLVVVLDDARKRADRLALVTGITAAFARAKDEREMIAEALAKLADAHGARAAWWHSLGGETLELNRRSGTVAECGALPSVVELDGVIQHEAQPQVLRDQHVVAQFGPLRLNHLLVVPVPGKTTMGCIVLGVRGYRVYRGEELRFLKNVGNELAMALESGRMVARLRESQRQWQSTFDSIDDLVLVHDDQMRIIAANKALLTKLGRSAGDVIGRTCEALLPNCTPDCSFCRRESYVEAVDECFGGHSVVSTSPYMQGDSPAGTIHIIRDTTARRATEERYRMLFHEMREGVFISTPEGRLVEFNDALVRMLGYSREELMVLDIGRDLYADPEVRPRVLEKAQEQDHLRDFELRLKRKDGSVIWVLESSFVTRDEHGRVCRYQGFLLDITQRKRAEEEVRRTQEQLLQSEKMSAVGQLISGVAHELNNPLTAILGYAQLLESEPIPERSRDFVQKLYQQATRTQRVVQNLLSFARQRKPQRSPVDVRRLLDTVISLRDYDLKLNGIEVRREFAESLPYVVADAHQLEQVFLNIINNASDAILQNGRGGSVVVRAFAQDNRVVCEFQDSGPGVPDTRKIFDPFFTTKPVGKGTGLGLSICYGIVKEHGGEISASNAPDGGAVFRIAVPEAVAPASAPIKTEVPAGAIHARVLLVDDEETVLDFEREVLRSAGADVVCATGGEAAIRLLSGNDFDVVVTDSKMPGELNGIDLLNWIRKNRPALAKSVILTVSNANDAETMSALNRLEVKHLVKPFSVVDLTATVKRASEGRAAATTG